MAALAAAIVHTGADVVVLTGVFAGATKTLLENALTADSVYFVVTGFRMSEWAAAWRARAPSLLTAMGPA